MMNLNKLVYHRVKSILFLTLLLVVNSTAYAKNIGCWADFFENAQYKGQHFRVKGPKKLKNLLNVNGENWDKRIESLIVGPKANLIVFEHKNLKLTLTEMANHPVLMKSLGITKQDILNDSELIFRANSKIHSFGAFHFYHKIRSLKVECVN